MNTITISGEDLKTLINAKMEFYNNTSKRDSFIDEIFAQYPDTCARIVRDVVFDHVYITNRGGDRKRVTKSDYENIRSEAVNGRKIEAIKLTRAATGWGLKEVKDYVEDNF